MELNGYRIMWLFVFFDLPTETKKDRRNSSGFRNSLLKDGFSMMKYSVYFKEENSPLMVALQKTASSLQQCYTGERKKIKYPKLWN